MVDSLQAHTIYIGSDHAGFSLKEQIKRQLSRSGARVIDVSGSSLQPTDDYPVIAYAVAQSVAHDKGTVGLITCGNAQGVAMVANKVPGIRAAIGYSLYGAKTSRQDDNSNVLCLAGRVLKAPAAWNITKTWLQTPYAKSVRFQRRLRQVLAIEKQQRPVVDIIPSILVSSATEFKQQIKKIERYFSLAQIDVADGHFVPAVTAIDWTSIQKARRELTFDLHLMVDRPDRWSKQIRDIKGIYRVFFHLESPVNTEAVIAQLKRKELFVGLALRPETPVARLKPYLKSIDAVLLLSVEPGFSGGKFLPKVVNKIKQLRRLNSSIPIIIDGGINPKTAQQVLQAGATSLVVNSFLQRSHNWELAIRRLGNRV